MSMDVTYTCDNTKLRVMIRGAIWSLRSLCTYVCRSLVLVLQLLTRVRAYDDVRTRMCLRYMHTYIPKHCTGNARASVRWHACACKEAEERVQLQTRARVKSRGCVCTHIYRYTRVVVMALGTQQLCCHKWLFCYIGLISGLKHVT